VFSTILVNKDDQKEKAKQERDIFIVRIRIISVSVGVTDLLVTKTRFS